MISINHQNSIVIIALVFVLVFVSSVSLKAQQEIPDNIKDILLKGINAVDSAKVPADVDRALDYFKEVNKLAPDFADVHYYLGKTLSMLEGNTRNAVKELKKYLELYPDAPDKENVEADIKRLEEDSKTNRKSALLGVKLMSLPDGVYIKSLDNKSIHRVSARVQKLYVGDKILKVNGEDVTGLNLQQVLNKIDSQSSENIKLTITRTGSPIDINISKAFYDRMAPFSLKQLGEEDLNMIIKESKVPVIVLWGTGNCTECLKYYSKLATVLMKYKEGLQGLEVDIEENKMIGDEFDIAKETVPVVSFYKDGKLVDKIIGFDKDLFEEKVEELME